MDSNRNLFIFAFCLAIYIFWLNFFSSKVKAKQNEFTINKEERIASARKFALISVVALAIFGILNFYSWQNKSHAINNLKYASIWGWDQGVKDYCEVLFRNNSSTGLLSSNTGPVDTQWCIQNSFSDHTSVNEFGPIKPTNEDWNASLSGIYVDSYRKGIEDASSAVWASTTQLCDVYTCINRQSNSQLDPLRAYELDRANISQLITKRLESNYY